MAWFGLPWELSRRGGGGGFGGGDGGEAVGGQGRGEPEPVGPVAAEGVQAGQAAGVVLLPAPAPAPRWTRFQSAHGVAAPRRPRCALQLWLCGDGGSHTASMMNSRFLPAAGEVGCGRACTWTSSRGNLSRAPDPCTWPALYATYRRVHRFQSA